MPIFARNRYDQMVKKQKNILSVLPLTLIARINKLGGIYRFIQEHHLNWHLKFFESDNVFSAEDVKSFLKSGIDGAIITMPGCNDAIDLLCQKRIPTVLIEQPHAPSPNLVRIENDEAGIGRMAARVFMRHGVYRSFGYVPAMGSFPWSQIRGKAFVEELSDSGLPCSTFTHGNPDAGLTQWIKSLAPPTAIFACHGGLANDVLEAGKSARRKIPSELSVLCVDNNFVFCEHTTPSLSYIEPNYEEMGYRAARALNGILLGKTQQKRLEVVPFKQIIYQRSTLRPQTSGSLIERALHYINRNATSGIGVRDVITHLGVSRRLLFLRFKEAGAGTVLQQITAKRLEETKKRLAKSADSIALVCSQCGWKSENHPKKLFKARYGMSMKEWRDSLVPKGQG